MVEDLLSSDLNFNLDVTEMGNSITGAKQDFPIEPELQVLGGKCCFQSKDIKDYCIKNKQTIKEKQTSIHYAHGNTDGLYWYRRFKFTLWLL